MGAFSMKARKAGERARRRKMALRKTLAERFGGTIGDYFPSRIKATVFERKIPIADVPAELVVKVKTMESGNDEESIPLDSPIFDKPEKRKYNKAKKGVPLADTREGIIIEALLDLIRRLR